MVTALPQDRPPTRRRQAPAIKRHQPARRSGDGTLPSLGRVRVAVYLPAPPTVALRRAAAQRIAALNRTGFLAGARLEVAIVRGQEWATAWKRFFRPLRIGAHMYIAPSWRDDFRPPPGGRVIRMDPGMAFGTGQHPTTKLAAAALLAKIRIGMTLIDVGCGSGILALSAAVHGARSYACDTDPIAVAATRSNFLANGLRAGAVARADGIPHTFPCADIITANISANTLAGLVPQFRRHLRHGGLLISSGVTAGTDADMLHAFSAAGLRLVGARRMGPWRAYVHRAP